MMPNMLGGLPQPVGSLYDLELETLLLVETQVESVSNLHIHSRIRECKAVFQ